MVMCAFPVLDWKHPIRVKLTEKSKLSVKAEIWYLDLLEYAESNNGIYFFSFLYLKQPFW